MQKNTLNFFSLPRHDKDKRIFMVEKYHEFKSSLKAIEAWKQKFPWSNEVPFKVVEKQLQDEKVLVWCAITSQIIYGPYSIEESVHQHNYLHMPKHFFWPYHNRVANYHTTTFSKMEQHHTLQIWFKHGLSQKLEIFSLIRINGLRVHRT